MLTFMTAPPDAPAPGAGRGVTSTPARFFLKSTLPRRSACGSLFAAAASPAARMRSAVGFWPVSSASASATRTAHGPAADSAMPACADRCRRRRATSARPRRRWRSRRPCARPSDTSRPCDRRARGTARRRAISPSPTAVVKLSTRNSSIGTVRSPDAPRTTTSARAASATAGQSPDGSLWHRLPTTVPIWRTTGSATTRETSWMRLQRRLANPRRPLDVDCRARWRPASASVRRRGCSSGRQPLMSTSTRRTRQAEAHGRDQALAAGQNPRLGAGALQQCATPRRPTWRGCTRMLLESRGSPPSSAIGRHVRPIADVSSVALHRPRAGQERPARLRAWSALSCWPRARPREWAPPSCFAAGRRADRPANRSSGVRVRRRRRAGRARATNTTASSPRSTGCPSATPATPSSRPAWAVRSVLVSSTSATAGRRDVRAGRPAVPDRRPVSARSSTPPAAAAAHRRLAVRRGHGAAAPVRSRRCSPNWPLCARRRRILQRHAAADARDAVRRRPADGHRHARGLRAGQAARVAAGR